MRIIYVNILVLTILYFFQYFLMYLNWYNFFNVKFIETLMLVWIFPSLYLLLLSFSENKVNFMKATVKSIFIAIIVIFLLIQSYWYIINWIDRYDLVLWYISIIFINLICFHIALILLLPMKYYVLMFVIYHWLFFYLTLQIHHSLNISESLPMLIANLCYMIVFQFRLTNFSSK